MDLTAFWIIPRQGRPPKPGWIHVDGQPVGLGVTAFDLADAIWMLRQAGYEQFVNAPVDELVIRRDVAFADLPQLVQGHVGPMVVRGVWYPIWRPFTERAPSE